MAEGTAKTIDQLPTKQSILGSDFIPLDDGTQSYKTTWAALLALTGGIASCTASGNTLTITTQGGQVFSFTPSDSSKQDVLTFDTVPTDGSNNPVRSDGIYDAIHEVSVALASEASTARAAEEANAMAIGTLNGNESTEGSVKNTCAEYITELIAGAPQSLDTLKEIADWIINHASDAAAMNSQIQSNTAAIIAETTRAQAAEAANASALQAYKDLLGLSVDEEGYICQTI